MNNELECEILNSMITYPAFITDFLLKVPTQAFSPLGQSALEIILSLNEQKALSAASFLNQLTKEQRENAFFAQVLGSNANADFVNLANTFMHNYKLQQQRYFANKMLAASDANELLDIEMLMQNQAEKFEYKNLQQWEQWLQEQPVLPKFRTNISFLDSVFDGGFEASQLVLISGDPEAGKTTLGVQILENISRYEKVCFFSFEFTIQQYIQSTQGKKLNKQNIEIINDGYDLYTIMQNIKNLHRQGIKVFLIDSQMRIVSPNGRNMEEEESLKFSALAKMCHSMGILIFLIVQTSKGDRDNPMGSKKGGHEASIIIRIEHDKAKDEQMRDFSADSRIIVLKKNKQTGKHYKEKVSFDPRRRIFMDYQSQKIPDESGKIDEIGIKELKNMIDF